MSGLTKEEILALVVAIPTGKQTNSYQGASGERVPYTPATFTGTKRILFPVSPRLGAIFAIKNITSSVASINLYSAAESIEDPLVGGLVAAATDIPISAAWIDVKWQYMESASGNAWHAVS